MKIFKDSAPALIFSLASVVDEFLAILQFLLNKSCKTYLGTMSSPSGRNWQLIHPNKKLLD